MCSRLACIQTSEKLQYACQYPKFDKEGHAAGYVQPDFITTLSKYTPSYVIRKGQCVTILGHRSHFTEASACNTEYVILPMRYGLLPQFYAEKYASAEHNSRIEAALISNFTAPEFLRNRRCVVLCDGFYKVRRTSKELGAYYFQLEPVNPTSILETSKNCDWKSDEIIKLAGIFSYKNNPHGQKMYSCSVISQDSDARFDWVDDCKPIILETFKDVEKWISPKFTCQESLEYLSNYDQNKIGKTRKYNLKNTDVTDAYFA